MTSHRRHSASIQSWSVKFKQVIPGDSQFESEFWLSPSSLRAPYAWWSSSCTSSLVSSYSWSAVSSVLSEANNSRDWLTSRETRSILLLFLNAPYCYSTYNLRRCQQKFINIRSVSIVRRANWLHSFRVVHRCKSETSNQSAPVSRVEFATIT